MFSNKMLAFLVGIHKMVVRIANWENPDQTASSEDTTGVFLNLILTLLLYDFLGYCKAVTYIRVTRHSIFQPHRYVGACIT